MINRKSGTGFRDLASANQGGAQVKETCRVRSAFPK
ncbi:unnamed protein product [Penicillium roqueforti FM164]|uniref:Genomic scaffold, ProqFM164S02 n=1 Tax=Penicillium roqueforti (strain FM164) TaxID=1365484 RepID=W6Q5C6_PENRF|nr:unnamed protein product [Penicillium roqueforti FM164]